MAEFNLSLSKQTELPFQLIWQDHSLRLLQTEIAKQGAIWVDFSSPQSDYRRLQVSIKKEAIARAVGLKSGKRPRVLDATAGLGRDAFVLAALGCQVKLVERHPVVAALLSDGLRRAKAEPTVSDIAERMALVNQSSLSYLQQTALLSAQDKPQVVYLDPMYPHPENKKKAAAVKKEMKSFQSLVGADLDADGLLQPALASATERVVVKRPEYAEPLAQQKPSHVISAKKNRFDVYMV
ncbi:16S rRNA methyltransferase [Saccharobesus litoralis]|uniref:Ribosomal RNA small subunit methyltransferase J n=1 Tax=Saccharobesus litoralis TaxID=2172099 RepID=A0A2S0VXQ7_9ALTE|nr:class I SAM-dependent methyltransferase [Saccharobesus litoralis]AWB68978.1 16S rRNA methyltransferase [Saccharobesus litoralis]